MKALKTSFLTMSLLISGAVVMQATAQTDTARIFSQSVTTFATSRNAMTNDNRTSPSGDSGGFRAPAAYAPSADIVFNRTFGGSADDYANVQPIAITSNPLSKGDVKLASDGTIWICGSTKSTDGDLVAAGNKGDADAWLLHINKA